MIKKFQKSNIEKLKKTEQNNMCCSANIKQ